jgi:tetratricopeptide (TPR) repeat protein/predicted Ser/Thr protein kinase
MSHRSGLQRSRAGARSRAAAGASEDSREAGAVDSLGATERSPNNDALADTAIAPNTEPGDIHRGETLGRYVVVSRLGHGGMSVVYSAYDPELDRKIALKLLHAHGESPAASLRLVREAQAMAQLSHENIVAVHDVGTFRDRTWIAMEFVEGQTLAQWLKESPRSWQEVLDVFLHAARGLQAAHAVGIVHRDFKPENVMISKAGKVRVMDFGLARAERPIERELPAALPELRKIRAFDVALTHTGARLGTPRYMAPEQWNGAETEARTDQFAFCVGLWQALHGAPPFSGLNLAELAVAVQRGQISPTPPNTTAPAWLRKIAERGLSVDPAQRFPSMDALIAAVAAGKADMRRRRVLAAFGTLGGAAAAVVVGGYVAQAQAIRACERVGDDIAQVWNDTARTALARGLAASGAPFAVSSTQKIGELLDRWSDDWRQLRAQSCREAEVERARPIAEGEAIAECLQERRDELSGLLDLLRVGDVATAEAAIPMAAGLARVAVCERPPTRPDAAISSEQQPQVAQVRRSLMQVHLLMIGGRSAEGLRRAEEALRRAEELQYAPLVAEARLAVGVMASVNLDRQRAEKELAAAFVEAGRLGDDVVAAKAATQLVFTVGTAELRFAEAMQWAKAADVHVHRAGQDDDLLAASLLKSRAWVFQVHGGPDEAIANSQAALAILERRLGPEHPSLIYVLQDLAIFRSRRGERDEVGRLLRRELEISEKALGSDHFKLAYHLHSLASHYRDAGDRATAEAYDARALPIFEAIVETTPDSVELAQHLDRLADIYEQRGDGARAIDTLRRSLTTYEAVLGRATSEVAAMANKLAGLYARQGLPREGMLFAEYELPYWEKQPGADAFPLARKLAALRYSAGRGREKAGDLDTAREHYQAALAKLGDAQDTLRGECMLGVARTLMPERAAEAIPLFEQVIALWKAEGRPPELLGTVQFLLAQALVHARGDRELARARKLAATAARAMQDKPGYELLAAMAAAFLGRR